MINRRLKGFTLVELLTVIAIVGVLAGLIVPIVGRVRANARFTGCASNLRQIGILFQLYSQDNKGCLPYAVSAVDGYSWDYHLAQYATNEETKSGAVPVSVFSCPSSDRKSRGTFDGAAYGSNIILLGNNHTDPPSIPQTRFASIQYPAATYLATDSNERTFNRSTTEQQRFLTSLTGEATLTVPERHDGRVNMLFADGSVRPLDAVTGIEWTNLGTGAPWGRPN
jgi:prepilin-type N-terminal cleavage/methylation domain-containing protein/prepilin-type processing-associated H-X9-DG protein